MTPASPDETILGLFAVRARHGYELLASFGDSRQFGEIWQLGRSQLYAVLKRLKSQGLTEGHELRGHRAPARTEYKLTTKGEAHLQAWLNDKNPSASMNRVPVEFLSRLYIAVQFGIPTQPIVENQRAARLKHKNELLGCVDRCETAIGRVKLSLTVSQLDVIIQWLNQCELRPKSFEER